MPKALFWGVSASTVVLAIAVGFFLHGGLLGLYVDDYTHKALARDVSAGKWRPTWQPMDLRFRPLHAVLTPNLTNTIPEYEFPTRVGVVLVHLLNVFLLGALAHRLTGSLLAGVLGSAYFFMPVFANEALLWVAAAVPITLSLCFLLVGFHCFLNARQLRGDLTLLASGLISWVVMILFYESGFFLLLLLPVFIGMLRSRGEPVSHALGLLALVASYVPIAGYLSFVLRASWRITGRGGTTFDLAFILSHRIPEVLRRLIWLGGGWGASGPLPEALELGRREWLAIPGGSVLLLAFLAGAVGVAITYPKSQDSPPRDGPMMALVVAGMAWAALALGPILLLKAQIVEIRTLYVPLAGAALSMAGVWSLLVGILGQWRTLGIRVILLVTGALVYVGSLTMAGLVRTYQLRWELDQRQLAAFKAAIPSLPPAAPIWLLPVELDERSVTPYWDKGVRLDRYVTGVFETPWSAADAIRMEFRRGDVYAVAATRWNRLRVMGVERSATGEVDAANIQGQPVPRGHLLAFTYQRGQVIGLNPLLLVPEEQAVPVIVDLPLVDRLHAAGLTVRPASLRLERP